MFGQEDSEGGVERSRSSSRSGIEVTNNGVRFDGGSEMNEIVLYNFE